MDAQMEHYSLPSIDSLMAPSAASGSVGPNGDIPNEAAGFSHLQSMGFPRRGSAYLAAAISAESNWQGDRAWGQVAGDGTNRNGGLVSWASWSNDPARLGQIERHFGTSIDKIPENKQLDYMVIEMKRSYPNEYRIFMNPNSSTADLKAAVQGYWGFNPKYTKNRWTDAERLLSGSNITPTGTSGARSSTGALTYSGNKQAYRSAGQAFQALGFKVAEQADFGGVAPVHAGNSYHKYDEAFDITHQTGGRAASIEKTRKLKDAVRSLGLFKEVLGPGDGDPNHSTHLHVGGLARPITQQDIEFLRSIG
jgi:hypothetical protein